MSKIRILAFYPNVMDATSFYRGHGVLSELHRIKGYPELEITETTKLNWAIGKGHDIIFYQRPFVKVHAELLFLAKLHNKKIWIDYDDVLTDLPSRHEAARKLGINNTKRHVYECVSYADVVTCSTQHIKGTLQKDFPDKKIIVIPNAWDNYMFPWEPRPTNADSNLIIWRGGNSHKHDLLSEEDSFIKLHDEYPNLAWLFIGYKPTFLLRHMKRARHQESFDLPAYHHYICNYIKPRMFVAPLEKHSFNEGKSAIVALEAGYAGAGCITRKLSGMSEFDLNISFYNDNLGFYDVFKSALVSKELMIARHSHFVQNVHRYRLSSLNINRMRLICDMIGVV